jgi:hypothetical protein
MSKVQAKWRVNAAMCKTARSSLVKLLCQIYIGNARRIAPCVCVVRQVFVNQAVIPTNFVNEQIVVGGQFNQFPILPGRNLIRGVRALQVGGNEVADILWVAAVIISKSLQRIPKRLTALRDGAKLLQITTTTRGITGAENMQAIPLQEKQTGTNHNDYTKEYEQSFTHECQDAVEQQSGRMDLGSFLSACCNLCANFGPWQASSHRREDDKKVMNLSPDRGESLNAEG